MSVQTLEFAEPFFPVKYLLDEKSYTVKEKSIILNLSKKDLKIVSLTLGFYRSTVVTNVTITNLARCLIIEYFERFGDSQELFESVRRTWTLAYEATKEARHKGVQLWRSPKARLGNVAVNMCYAGSVPLNVGLHQTHWGGPPIKEIHTQIVGYGKMQHCSAQDIKTLYREELMAPGCSHMPMYDENCLYPWHQYETITPGIFMATEMQMTEEMGV